jgi:hypothetical protein
VHLRASVINMSSKNVKVTFVVSKFVKRLLYVI